MEIDLQTKIWHMTSIDILIHLYFLSIFITVCMVGGRGKGRDDKIKLYYLIGVSEWDENIFKNNKIYSIIFHTFLFVILFIYLFIFLQRPITFNFHFIISHITCFTCFVFIHPIFFTLPIGTYGMELNWLKINIIFLIPRIYKEGDTNQSKPWLTEYLKYRKKN